MQTSEELLTTGLPTLQFILHFGMDPGAVGHMLIPSLSPAPKLCHNTFGSMGTNTVIIHSWALRITQKSLKGLLMQWLPLSSADHSDPLMSLHVARKAFFVKNSKRPKTFWARTLLLFEMRRKICRRYGSNSHTATRGTRGSLAPLSFKVFYFLKKLQWRT